MIRKRTRSHLLAALLVAWTAPLAARAELPHQARALFEQSIAAHSSGPAKLRLVYQGQIPSPDQSARPEAPFRGNAWTITIAIDEHAGALAFRPDLAIDGDFSFRSLIGFSNGRGFALSYTGDVYDELSAFPPHADAYLPHRLLRDVLASAQTARIQSNGAYDRLAYTTASAETRTLVFDRRTRLLAAIERSATPTVYGDQRRDTLYRDYRRIGAAVVPGSITLRIANPIHGALDRELRLVEASGEGPTAAELAPPLGAVARRPSPREFETVRLGRDVYLLRNVATEGLLSYNVLAVEFENEMLVVEAALNAATSQRVIESVTKLAPRKPIRRLIQTHHHGDHIGGIRTYIARGTTIIAPRGMRGLIDRIGATHSALAPDDLARAPRQARVEEVRGKRIIRDRRNEVRLYDVPSDHSAHMLVVYLPEQQVLYQGDLISAGEIPLNGTSRHFLAWLRERELSVRALAGVHGRTLVGEEVEALLRAD